MDSPSAQAPPGWHEDQQSGGRRWWDGQRWSTKSRPQSFFSGQLYALSQSQLLDVLCWALAVLVPLILLAGPPLTGDTSVLRLGAGAALMVGSAVAVGRYRRRRPGHLSIAAAQAGLLGLWLYCALVQLPRAVLWFFHSDLCDELCPQQPPHISELVIHQEHQTAGAIALGAVLFALFAAVALVFLERLNARQDHVSGGERLLAPSCAAVLAGLLVSPLGLTGAAPTMSLTGGVDVMPKVHAQAVSDPVVLGPHKGQAAAVNSQGVALVLWTTPAGNSREGIFHPGGALVHGNQVTELDLSHWNSFSTAERLAVSAQPASGDFMVAMVNGRSLFTARINSDGDTSAPVALSGRAPVRADEAYVYGATQDAELTFLAAGARSMLLYTFDAVKPLSPEGVSAGPGWTGVRLADLAATKDGFAGLKAPMKYANQECCTTILMDSAGNRRGKLADTVPAWTAAGAVPSPARRLPDALLTKLTRQETLQRMELVDAARLKGRTYSLWDSGQLWLLGPEGQVSRLAIDNFEAFSMRPQAGRLVIFGNSKTEESYDADNSPMQNYQLSVITVAPERL